VGGARIIILCGPRGRRVRSGLDSDPRARNNLGTRLEVSGSYKSLFKIHDSNIASLPMEDKLVLTAFTQMCLVYHQQNPS